MATALVESARPRWPSWRWKASSQQRKKFTTIEEKLTSMGR
jgi:hypothetical protein